ncbi:DUF7919 family protein [Actinokineospora spheciospongiae]
MSAYGHAELTRPWKAAVNVGRLGPDAEIGGPDGTVYAVPTLIGHHVAEHGYRPPQ